MTQLGEGRRQKADYDMPRNRRFFVYIMTRRGIIP
jgi:hypothetical protein